MSRGKNAARVVFWVLFIPAAAAAGYYFWQRGIPQRIDRDLKNLTHGNARIASQAWWDLRELYFTKWAAVDILIEHTGDPEPIHFLIEMDKRPVPGKAALDDFVTNGRPIFYKADRVYCRTVGEAIMAFMYNERKWRTDYNGDWQEWWQANKGYYGKP